MRTVGIQPEPGLPQLLHDAGLGKQRATCQNAVQLFLTAYQFSALMFPSTAYSLLICCCLIFHLPNLILTLLSSTPCSSQPCLPAHILVTTRSTGTSRLRTAIFWEMKLCWTQFTVPGTTPRPGRRPTPSPGAAAYCGPFSHVNHFCTSTSTSAEAPGTMLSARTALTSLRLRPSGKEKTWE
jgi:hypothetical protein